MMNATLFYANDTATTETYAHALHHALPTSSSNYTISFTGSYLTITPATLTVKANPQTKVYGQADPTPRSDTACASLPGYSPAPPSPRYITPADAHNGSTHPATPPYQTTLSP